MRISKNAVLMTVSNSDFLGFEDRNLFVSHEGQFIKNGEGLNRNEYRRGLIRAMFTFGL